MKKQITYVLAWHSACQSYLWSVVSKCIIPKGAVADRARKDIRKNEWEVLCLSRKLLFATSLPPGPLDTLSAVSRPVPSVILLSGDCRPNSDPGPRLTAAPPPLSCRLRVNFRDRASGWTDSMVAGQLRLLDSVKLDRLCPLELSLILTGRLVHATSDSESSRRPAWLGVRVGRERPATLRTDSDVTGSACQCIVPFSSAQTPLQLHLQEYG